MKLPHQCPKCSGTGVYHWGAFVNGKPSKSGTCNSCGGKGHQSLQDVRRNYGYNNKNWEHHQLAMSVSMADAFHNELVKHQCNTTMAWKAGHKHGLVNAVEGYVEFADKSRFDLSTYEGA